MAVLQYLQSRKLLAGDSRRWCGQSRDLRQLWSGRWHAESAPDAVRLEAVVLTRRTTGQPEAGSSLRSQLLISAVFSKPLRLAMRRVGLSWFVGICVGLSLTVSPSAQQQVLGSIVGRIRVVRGSAPVNPVLISLEFRSATMNSVYSDSSGTFGFHYLPPNPYYVIVNDDAYEPVRQMAVIDATMLAP